PAVHAQKRGGTMRFVPHADLKVLDPIWTTAYITRNHCYLIYDTLFGTDQNLQIKPQMVDKWSSANKGMKWSFTLRDGLKWHDGQPVVAEDAVESIKRWSKRDPLGKLLAAHTARIAAQDKKTFTLELAQPFGLVLEALGKPSKSTGTSNRPSTSPSGSRATRTSWWRSRTRAGRKGGSGRTICSRPSTTRRPARPSSIWSTRRSTCRRPSGSRSTTARARPCSPVGGRSRRAPAR